VIPILRHQNRVLSIDNSPIVANAVGETYLTAEVSASTLTVKSITGFGINQILLIGELGTENAEIVLTHASTAPSGTTITLSASLGRTHYVGEKVRIILFNQFELSRAPTAAGTKTVLVVSGGMPPSGLGTGLIAIDPGKVIQSYEDVEFTTGYYFARYKHSVETTFGGYTDALIYGGWAKDTVQYMIDGALRRIGRTLSELFTEDDAFREINECLRFIKGKQVRWPEHSSFNYVAGQTSRGTHIVAMPTDAYDLETNRSIQAVRVGNNPTKLIYLDSDAFDAQMDDTVYTQVTTQAVATDTTLAIDNSYDFEDSGTVHVYVSGTKYSITYTGVTRSASAGVLTGIPASGDGSITVTIAVDVYVWQNETEGIPKYFTVRNSNIEFWPLADATEDNQNIFLDYDKVATAIDSDGDTIDFHRYDMVLDYLTWKMWTILKNDGILDMNNNYYIQFKEKLNDSIRTSRSGQVFPWRPKINRINYRGGTGSYISSSDRSGSN